MKRRLILRGAMAGSSPLSAGVRGNAAAKIANAR
jgi:hypothetical protein